MKHQIFIRSQHSRGSGSNAFGGPDTYVAVVSRPDDKTEWPQSRPLNRDHLRKHGYQITYCGEGYSRNDGPRSMLGQALLEAHRIAG
jgi:hypothetical protein